MGWTSSQIHMQFWWRKLKENGHLEHLEKRRADRSLRATVICEY